MPIIERGILRRHLRRQLREGGLTDEQARDVRDIFHNTDALDQLAARAGALAQDSADVTPEVVAGAGAGGLLNWLWEHRAEILAFIQEIIKLFRP